MNTVLNFLNHHAITFNGSMVNVVTYDKETDTFTFTVGEDWDDFIQVERGSIGCANWDEDDLGDAFYIFIDTNQIHHIVRLYRKDSLDMMRDLKLILWD